MHLKSTAPTRSRLIDVAVDLFYRKGFQAVGLDEILDRVGITKTAFYKHFESKDDLIVAVLEKRDGDDIADLLGFMRAHGGADARARLLSMFDQLHGWMSDPGFRGCLFQNAATEFPSTNDPINRAATAHGENIGAIVRRDLVELAVPDPDATAQQWMMLFAGAITARHARNELDAALSARGLAEALLDRAAPARR